ncbi:MAG: hypothetical protein QOH31_1125 [Verrucomicrobiota bacterium]|jgi:hypothetical protein
MMRLSRAGNALGVFLFRLVFGPFPDLYLLYVGAGVRINVNRTLNFRSVLLALSLVTLVFRLDAFSFWIHAHGSEVVPKPALRNERVIAVNKRIARNSKRE